MKKSNLFWAMAAGVLAFSACSKTESGIVPENDGAAQQIVLQVANGGDLTTRAGRPMYGSEAKQTIENVKLIICNDQPTKNVLYEKTITDWQTSSDLYTDGGHGREMLVELTGDAKLQAGRNYKVYAIGYHNASDYSNLKTAVIDITKGGTFNENVKLTLNQAAGNKIGEEIFAGSLDFTPAAEVKGFRKYIVLNRQVAGVFGYVNEIPYFRGATNLKLVASARNTGLVLGHFANVQLPDNGGENSKNTVNYVINGETPAGDKELFNITLSDWFTAIKPDANGFIDGSKENWHVPAEYSANAAFKTGSVFGGNFVIPFAKDATPVSPKNTLELQLTDGGGKVLRTWIVKLPATDGQIKTPHALYTWNGTQFDEKLQNKDEQKLYNIVRNHLYGIGTRNEDKPVDPDKPNPDPDPTDPDEPESLNNKQDIILQVNDNWEVIHKMELE